MEKKKRDSSIDAIKGLAIVLVMIGHVFVHNQMEDPYIYDFIKAVQMPLFMIVSGYLCGMGRKITDISSYGKIMKKRAAAYLVPFFSWLVLQHLNHLRLAFGRIFFELDYGLWFLAVLFLLTFMVYNAQFISSILGGRKKAAGELVFWGVYGLQCLVLVIQILTGNSLFSPYLTILYVPFYMLGYVAGNYGRQYFCWNQSISGKIDCRNNWWIRGSMLVAGLAVLYLVAARNLNSMESKADTIIQMAASLFGSMAVIYGVFFLPGGKIKNFFAKIGNYTLEIYVVHYHFANVLNVQQKVYDVYTPQGAVFVITSFTVMSILTFVLVLSMKKIKILDKIFFGKF